METVTLNSKELEVYNACKAEAKISGDNGYEFNLEFKIKGITKNQLKGYLSQLVQKGLIMKFDKDSSYFSFSVNELTPAYYRYSGGNYDFNIVCSDSDVVEETAKTEKIELSIKSQNGEIVTVILDKRIDANMFACKSSSRKRNSDIFVHIDNIISDVSNIPYKEATFSDKCVAMESQDVIDGLCQAAENGENPFECTIMCANTKLNEVAGVKMNSIETIENNFTELEIKLIEVLKSQDEFEGMPTGNIRDLAFESKINEKVLRGVISSLVKKNVVIVGEFPNGKPAIHYKG